jgi:hypothetical protein
VVVVAVAVVGSLVLDNPIKTIPAQQEPHKELQAKAEAEVTEPEVVVEVVDKMAVLAVDFLTVTTEVFLVKMATVWHPEVV